ncbi:unnamed protein product [Discosporangium mesarthrocarpum]
MKASIAALVTCMGMSTGLLAPTSLSKFQPLANKAQSFRCVSRPSMFFDFGKKNVATADTKPNRGNENGRPVAGATTAGNKKTKVSSVSSWTGPAVERRRRYIEKKAVEDKAKQGKTGYFSPQQMDAFKRARQQVPSGSGKAYWEAIAARVPGQSAINCKKMAETLLLQKAAGTQAGFFGSYIDVKETKDYVDEDADVMGKIGRFFGGGK